MTRHIFAPLAGAVVIVAIGIALLAPKNGTIIDPVANAADTTAAAGTAEFGIAGSVTGAGQTIPINGNGALDMRHGRMRMSMSFPIPGTGQSDIEELFDGSTFYIHFPSALAQRLPGGKSWMKVDLAALGKAQRGDIEQMMQANQTNPADILKALKAVGDSQVVGQEDIRGAATTHYRATIDFDKVAERVGDKQSADAIKQLVKSSGASLPVDVWIDRAGRVRREHVSFSATDVGMDMTIEFTRFGAPVDVSAPPADQVLDAGALAGAAGTTNG